MFVCLYRVSLVDRFLIVLLFTDERSKLCAAGLLCSVLAVVIDKVCRGNHKGRNPHFCFLQNLEVWVECAS